MLTSGYHKTLSELSEHDLEVHHFVQYVTLLHVSHTLNHTVVSYTNSPKYSSVTPNLCLLKLQGLLTLSFASSFDGLSPLQQGLHLLVMVGLPAGLWKG